MEPAGWMAPLNGQPPNHDMSRPLPPGESQSAIDKIRVLPRWAAVAFAARCARHACETAQHTACIMSVDEEEDARLLRLLGEYVEFAESCAYSSAWREQLDRGCAAGHIPPTLLAWSRGKASEDLELAMRVAIAAASAAHLACDGGDPRPVVEQAWCAAMEIVESTHGAHPGTRDSTMKCRIRLMREMSDDLALLADATSGGNWPDSCKLPRNFFGEHYGVPAASGIPGAYAYAPPTTFHATSASCDPTPHQERMPIRLCIDPGNASENTIRDVLIALSDLHIAAGGGGLSFSEGECASTTEGGVIS